MNWSLLIPLLCGIVVLLVVLEYFWIKGSRERLVRKQEREWLDTQKAIRSTLGDPDRRQAIADAQLRAVSNQAYLSQLCETTANSLGAPAAVITVVEHEGQKWLAYYGAEWCSEDIRQGLMEPLETSYCQYVVHTDHALVISDSFRDIRVRHNSAVTRQTVRAYIGAPIHTIDGHVIGSLCVFDQKPRRWTARDRATVESLAALVRL